MLETALVLVLPYYCVCDCDQNNCLKSLNDLALTLEYKVLKHIVVFCISSELLKLQYSL